MKMLLNTSSSTTELILVTKANQQVNYQWESGRELSKDLLKYMKERLNENGADFSDLTGLGFYRGPGSFTGLRIGVTVMNALSYALKIPIVGSTNDNWISDCVIKLDDSKNDQMLTPFYGAEANITKPRK